MKLKKMFPAFAIALGLVLAIATSGFKEKSIHQRVASSTEYYFQFTGSHGNESSTSLWQEMSANDYDNLDCLGSNAGCKIITTSVTGTIPNRHPSAVPVDANSKPLVSGATIEAAYRN